MRGRGRETGPLPRSHAVAPRTTGHRWPQPCPGVLQPAPASRADVPIVQGSSSLGRGQDPAASWLPGRAQAPSQRSGVGPPRLAGGEAGCSQAPAPTSSLAVQRASPPAAGTCKAPGRPECSPEPGAPAVGLGRPGLACPDRHVRPLAEITAQSQLALAGGEGAPSPPCGISAMRPGPRGGPGVGCSWLLAAGPSRARWAGLSDMLTSIHGQTLLAARTPQSGQGKGLVPSGRCPRMPGRGNLHQTAFTQGMGAVSKENGQTSGYGCSQQSRARPHAQTQLGAPQPLHDPEKPRSCGPRAQHLPGFPQPPAAGSAELSHGLALPGLAPGAGMLQGGRAAVHL